MFIIWGYQESQFSSSFSLGTMADDVYQNCGLPILHSNPFQLDELRLTTTIVMSMSQIGRCIQAVMPIPHGLVIRSTLINRDMTKSGLSTFLTSLIYFIVRQRCRDDLRHTICNLCKYFCVATKAWKFSLNTYKRTVHSAGSHQNCTCQSMWKVVKWLYSNGFMIISENSSVTVHSEWMLLKRRLSHPSTFLFHMSGSDVHNFSYYSTNHIVLVSFPCDRCVHFYALPSLILVWQLPI